MLKTIFSNTLAQLVAKFISAGLTFLTTALIIRLSGTSIFGDLTKSLVLIAIGFTVIDFGLNAITVRSLGRGHNQARSFTELLFARLVLSVLVVLVLNLLVQLLPGGYTAEIKSVFWLGSLAILFQGIYTSCNAIFQFQENYWRSALATISGTLVGTGLTYYFILTSPTLANFLLAQTVGYLLMAALSLYLLKTHLSPVRLSALVPLICAAAPLGAILLASVAASKLDTIILGIYRASSEVGEYGFAYRIFDVILVLPAFLMNAVYPRLVKQDPTHSTQLIRQISRLMLVLGVSSAIAIYFASPLIHFIRPGLSLSILSLRLLSFSLPLFFLTAPLMWQQIAQRKEMLLLKIYFSAALLNALLNLFFIPGYGAPAAASITIVTELFIFLSLLYFSHKS